jgi:anti-sigma regulatory factor (Ser/Thr protein kinase)
MHEEHCPPYRPDVASCGFFLMTRPDGFVLHMSASAEHLHDLRARVAKAVASSGAPETVAEAARLLASELVGNVARLCGPWAPVVVLVAITENEVTIRVHDPVSSVLPDREGEPPDNARAESGRGLWILDVLAPGWTVQPSPVGKQITCTLPRHAPAVA